MSFFFFLRIKWRFNDGKVISMVESIKGFEINCSGVIANYIRMVTFSRSNWRQILLVRFDSLDNQ